MDEDIVELNLAENFIGSNLMYIVSGNPNKFTEVVAEQLTIIKNNLSNIIPPGLINTLNNFHVNKSLEIFRAYYIRLYPTDTHTCTLNSRAKQCTCRYVHTSEKKLLELMAA